MRQHAERHTRQFGIGVRNKCAFIYDRFEESKDTAITSHKSDSGHTWAAHALFGNGMTVVPGGLVRGNSGASTSLYMVSGVHSDEEYDVRIDFVAAARATSAFNGICTRLDPTVSTGYHVYFTGTVIELLLLVSGTPTTLVSAAFVPELWRRYKWRFECRNAMKRLFVDDSLFLEHADNTIRGPGRIGLRARSDGHVGNFRVEGQ